MSQYVHGYSARETQRLQEQSGILEELLHSGTVYPPGSRVLEAGCGVGGQTVVLAERNPGAEFTCIDVSSESLDKARSLLRRRGLSNVRFERADIMALPFDDESFDHIFVCFVLEHLSDPSGALDGLRRVLETGGGLTVIEGDHGSCFWHPQTRESMDVWECMIEAQQRLGHDPLIGRRLHPLLSEARFRVEDVSPKWVYGDAGKPVLLDGVVNQIIVPMVQTARRQSLETGMIDETTWDRGILGLERSGMPPEGTFFYTWFKAVAVK
jgi:ubiquinone/menaquinone biosynthesis C-methylase UbiE